MDIRQADKDRIEDRVQRELLAHTEDDVLAEAYALKDRWPHIKKYPSLLRMLACQNKFLDTAANQFVLDLGCGNGERSLQLLKGGANVFGIDISPVYIENATRTAEAAGFDESQFEFRAMDAHHLEYDDEVFDMVVGNGILHHLDLKASTLEIQRVLKPGGRALFVEPLLANPLLKVFRMLTPKARTEDERPLSPADLRMFAEDKRWRVESSYCGIFEAPVAMTTSLLLRKYPQNVFLSLADVAERGLHGLQWLNPMNQYVLLNLVRV